MKTLDMMNGRQEIAFNDEKFSRNSTNSKDCAEDVEEEEKKDEEGR
jgi:hypothetical protein